MASTKPLPRAAHALCDALDAQDINWTQAELAQALGVTQQAVSGWLRGRCRPSPEAMLKLEKLYGVPVRWWFELAPKAAAAASRVNAKELS